MADERPRIETIYLDIDEVLVDWTGGVMRLLGIDRAEALAKWDALDPRPWDFFDALGLDAEEAWRRIDEAGPEFWRDLEWLPWGQEVYELCCASAPTVLVTSPSPHVSCVAGKLAWLHKHFGPCAKSWAMTPSKFFFAHPGALLIDDSPHNCASFVEAGGRALLFPGVGNYRHDLAPSQVVPYLLARLKEYRWL